MMAARQNCPLACPSQSELDWFRRAGVNVLALATPIAMQVAIGSRGQDGHFDPDSECERWFAFEEVVSGDIIFWHSQTGELAVWSGRAFALGEEIIDLPETYSFDCSLNIFVDPLDWLLAKRDGIVVLPSQWDLAFDRLRDCPRIALAEQLLPIYRRHMRPQHLPELSIIPQQRRAA